MQATFSVLSISHHAKPWLNAGVDIREIRQKNLGLLLKEFDTAAALAKAADTDPAYISQIRSKKTKREIGDSLARRLEKAGKKERGWLDHSHDATPLPKQQKPGRGVTTRHEDEWLEVYRSLPSSERRRFLGGMRAIAATYGSHNKKAV